MSTHATRPADFGLALTRRQIDTLADRLQMAANALGLEPGQLLTLQALVHPEQFAVRRGPPPTRAAPGTHEKVSVLERRARFGRPVFADEDAIPEHDTEPATRFVLVVPLAADTYPEARELALDTLGVPTDRGRGARGRELPDGCSIEKVLDEPDEDAA